MSQAPNSYLKGLLQKLGDSKVSVVTATSTLRPDQNIVFAITGASNITITLPPVAECAGMTFIVYHHTDGGGNVVVQDQDDSLGTDYATAGSGLTAAGDYVIVSNYGGLFWVEQAELTT